ncbi:hypothetical protein C0J52_16509 [Blattella germanica]|nr:hypothetical protein C0J52_16509 [Blattella germanica]
MGLGLSDFGYALGIPFCLSILPNNLDRGDGVAGELRYEHFSSNVLGVAGESNKRKALTLLYGGEIECNTTARCLSSFPSSGEESSECAVIRSFGMGLLELKFSLEMSKPFSMLASHPDVCALLSNSLSTFFHQSIEFTRTVAKKLFEITYKLVDKPLPVHLKKEKKTKQRSVQHSINYYETSTGAHKLELDNGSCNACDA